MRVDALVTGAATVVAIGQPASATPAMQRFGLRQYDDLSVEVPGTAGI
jgi:hypothetical protein